MSADVTFPVQVLREHSTALEAALSVCLANPGHKPVHKLRTETRRLEAELLLLSHLPQLPEHSDQSTSLLKQLKRLRRAAGAVRDLDVHRKLLDEYIEANEPPQPSPNGTADPNVTNGKATRTPGRRKGTSLNATAPESTNGASSQPEKSALHRDATRLRAHMGKQRDAAAEDLQKLLKKRQTKASAAAESLLKVLQPAEDLTLPVEDLLQHAHALPRRDHLLDDKEIANLSGDELHTVRKAAKAARYLAETIPDNPLSAEAARNFEAIQEAGGQWHDLLDLARSSKRYLGKQHELTVALTAERDRRLDLYREALQADRKALAPPEKVPGAKDPHKTTKRKGTAPKKPRSPSRARAKSRT